VPKTASKKAKSTKKPVKTPKNGGNNRLGRPTKLLPSTAASVLAAIERGSTFEGAAASANLSVRTLHGWLAQGRSPGASRELADFASSVDLARAKAESIALEELRQGVNVAGMPDWRAREVWLRLSFPARYGAKAVNDRKVRAAVEEILSGVLARISTAAAGEVLAAIEAEFRSRGLLEEHELEAETPALPAATS
jgi:hypothetical protein